MHADLVFAGGPVHTGDTTRARFAAVTGDRITAVGDDPRPYVGPRTEVVDLGGRLLLPGFQDAHVHAVGAGIELGRCDLTRATTGADCVDAVAAYAAANPEPAWLTGSGWALDLFAGGLPHRRLLDDVVPDRPVVLVNRDHHGAWLNSAALARAGITAATPDPPGGHIERDATGAPTGVLQEGAMDLVTRLLPPETEAGKLAGLLRAQRLLHSLGVTAWQDPLLGEYGGMPDPSSAYAAAAGRGTLTARVTGALWWDRGRGADQLPELLARRESLRREGFRAESVKIMLDGVAENHTAALLGPYLGTGHSGLSFVAPAALREHVTLLDAHGFQVHFHALGDRAVRDALDAVEAARAANGPGRRHHLAHLQVVHPGDVPRFRRLGATATVQPLWAVHEPQMDELTIPFLGAERAAWQYPFGDLLRSGARLAAGSDWPVSSPDPLQGIHVAVNRIPYGEDVPPFLPEQRIGLAAAIAAYTAGSAYVNHLDDTGVLRPGFRADLVVLDRDPFDGPGREIGAARAAMTFTGGRCVHES